MFLYCNGDSIVAGTELGDDILPDYPGLANFDSQLDAERTWINNTYDPAHPHCALRESQTTELVRLEYERSFPSKLGKLLNCEVQNRAIGGASMDRIVRTTIADLISLRKQHDRIVAVIGDTHYSRSEVANSEEFKYYDGSGLLNHWACVSTTYRMINRKPLDAIIDYKIIYEKNYHMLVRYYKNVILLQDFCKANNIDLYWVSSYNSVFETIVEDEYQDDICYNNLKEYSNLNFSLEMKQVAQDLYYKVLCPSGHFGENVHQETAVRLATIINNS